MEASAVFVFRLPRLIYQISTVCVKESFVNILCQKKASSDQFVETTLPLDYMYYIDCQYSFTSHKYIAESLQAITRYSLKNSTQAVW